MTTGIPFRRTTELPTSMNSGCAGRNFSVIIAARIFCTHSRIGRIGYESKRISVIIRVFDARIPQQNHAEGHHSSESILQNERPWMVDRRATSLIRQLLPNQSKLCGHPEFRAFCVFPQRAVRNRDTHNRDGTRCTGMSDGSQSWFRSHL